MSVHRIDTPSERLVDMSPDAAQATLDKARDIMVGEQPTMPDPPDTVVTLFRGLWQDGQWHREARVRELTGADEEGIARMMTGTGQQLYLNAMTSYGVESVGPYVFSDLKLHERTGLLNELLVGEKEMLFLHVLKATYGDRRTVGVRCPTLDCGAITDVSFSITEDVPVRQLDDPNRTTYDYVCRDGTIIEYRLVTGNDSSEAQRRPNATTPEENTILLSRVIVSVNGSVPVDQLHYARNLGAMDRRELLRDLVAKQPGPYFEEVKLPCATCGSESIFMPTWADLL